MDTYFLHDLENGELNTLPDDFIYNVYIACGVFYDWFKPGMNNQAIEKKILEDLTEDFKIWITSSGDAKLRILGKKEAREVFNLPGVVETIKKIYNETAE